MLNQTLTSDLPSVNQNPDLNPTLEFSILLNADKLEKLGYLPDNFKLISLKNLDIINQKYSWNHNGYIEIYFPLNSTVSDYQVSLAYTCGSDPNCTFEEGNKINSYDKKFRMDIGFNAPIIDHQNPINPILYDKKIYNTYGFNLNFSRLLKIDLNWEVIEYKEKKGIDRLFNKVLKRKDVYYTGYIESSKTYREETFNYTKGNEVYKILSIITINNDHNSYIEYKRKKLDF